MFGKLFSLLATAAMVTKQVYGQHSGMLNTRDVELSSILDYRGAVLLINRKQTSCEAALVDSNAAFISASCFEYSGSTTVDTSKNTYELMIKLGSGNSNSQKVSISKINVHPKYDPKTYINNVAIVQFSTGGAATWQEYIAVNPSEWDDQYFSRRSLTDSYSSTWNNIIAFSSTTTPSDCAKASKAYSENKQDFLCNYAASLSIYNRDCKVPYGTVYAVVQPDDFGVAAIYSHSAIYGDSMCSSQKKLHYYTILRNYIPWAARAIGRSIGGFSKDSSFKLAIDYDYSMTEVSTSSVSGVQVFSGDRYSQDPVNPALADPSPPPETSAPASATQATTKPPATSAGASTQDPQTSDKPDAPATSAGQSNNASNGSSVGSGTGTSDDGKDDANSNSPTSGTNGSSAAPTSASETKGSSNPVDNGEDSNNNDGGEGGQATVLVDDPDKPSTSAATSGNSNNSGNNNSSTNASTTDKGVTDIGPSETEDNASPSSSEDASNNSSANNAEDESKGGSSKTIIIIVVIVLLLLAIGGGLWWLWKRKQRKKQQSIVEQNGWRDSRQSLGTNDSDSMLGPTYSTHGDREQRQHGRESAYSLDDYYAGDRDQQNRDSSYPSFSTPGSGRVHKDDINNPMINIGGHSQGGPSNFNQGPSQGYGQGHNQGYGQGYSQGHNQYNDHYSDMQQYNNNGNRRPHNTYSVDSYNI
ncbi:hypothetical protein FB645_002827 [Coemansia sp. IMI 203386]|nr:hypothetical protein FB645_002827 [Coemansia sp. IMI 203386]